MNALLFSHEFCIYLECLVTRESLRLVGHPSIGIRRQSTTDEILIARGFRRESTNEDLMRSVTACPLSEAHSQLIIPGVGTLDDSRARQT